ncbi:MAG: sulfatase family protein [Opitutales bacterium]
MIRSVLFLMLSLATLALGKNQPPNIVYILADDMGYGDVSLYNPEGKIPTPNIDRLGKEGMMFTNAHTPSSVCTPTRYALMTGRYCWRSRLKQGVLLKANEPSLIEKDRLTVADLLKSAGYKTEMIGKWHIGMKWPEDDQSAEAVDWSAEAVGGPVDCGFDRFFGVASSLDIPPYTFIDERTVTKLPTERFTEKVRAGPGAPGFELDEALPTLADEAVASIRAKRDDSTPFFLYFSLTSPHTPIVPTEEYRGKSGLNLYGDFVMQTDAVVGQILQVLEETGQAEDTLVIFTADNGCAEAANFRQLLKKGHNPSGPWRGAKTSFYEGGHRVPFVLRWPARVKPGGQSNEPVCVTDFMRTAAALTDTEMPEDAAPDSFDMSHLFLRTEPAGPVRDLIISQSFNGLFSIADARWKLIPNMSGKSLMSYPNDDQYPDRYDTWQLYDLQNDPGETANVYAEHPEEARRLAKRFLEAVDSGRLTPGPALQNYEGENRWHQVNSAEEILRQTSAN